MTPEQIRLGKMCSVVERIVDLFEKFMRTDQNAEPVIIMCQYVPMAVAEVEAEIVAAVRGTIVNYMFDTKREFDESLCAKVYRLRDTAPVPPVPSTPTPTEVAQDGTLSVEVGKQKKPRKKRKPHGSP